MKSFVNEKEQKLSKACLINIAGISYPVLMRLLKNKDVKVNGKRVSSDCLIKIGDKIDVYFQEKKIEAYTVIYKDDNVLVINKKSGYTSDSIFEMLLNDFGKVYYIHRLDRNTNGIMIFALNETAESELLLGFKNHTFIKEYKAEVYGFMEKDSDILSAYLIKDEVKGEVKIFDTPIKNALPIKTGYSILQKKENTSILLVRLFTGKTHQIRAHLAHVGHFVVGDGKYGNNKFNKEYGFKEQQLSSYRLTLSFNKESCLYYLNGKMFTL